MRLKNWNRMQNAAALWDILSMCGIRIIHYVVISLIREKDWYDIRDILVPILIDVKFPKCHDSALSTNILCAGSIVSSILELS